MRRGGGRCSRRAVADAGVGAIGTASLLADLGHEIPTALLQSFLTSTLRAPAAALSAIEGVADGLAGAARFAGGALADDPHRHRDTADAAYTATAVLTAAIGVTTAAWQVGVLRAGPASGATGFGRTVAVLVALRCSPQIPSIRRSSRSPSPSITKRTQTPIRTHAPTASRRAPPTVMPAVTRDASRVRPSSADRCESSRGERTGRVRRS